MNKWFFWLFLHLKLIWCTSLHSNTSNKFKTFFTLSYLLCDVTPSIPFWIGSFNTSSNCRLPFFSCFVQFMRLRRDIFSDEFFQKKIFRLHFWFAKRILFFFIYSKKIHCMMKIWFINNNLLFLITSERTNKQKKAVIGYFQINNQVNRMFKRWLYFGRIDVGSSTENMLFNINIDAENVWKIKRFRLVWNSNTHSQLKYTKSSFSLFLFILEQYFDERAFIETKFAQMILWVAFKWIICTTAS